MEAILAEEEQEADDLAIPSDPVLIDAYLANSYRRCLSGPYREGTIRSQRNLFGVFLDRPAGMSEVMMGQTRSASVTRRKESMIYRGDSSVILQTPSTEHFIRFVADNAIRPEPWAVEEDKVVTDSNYRIK